MNIRHLTAIVATWLIGAAAVHAQWVRTPANPIPRTADGKANLSAPAPRTAEGKPDLSGVWQAQGSPIPELIPLLPLNGENGLGEDLPTKYFISVFADFKPGEAPLKPAAQAAASKLSLLAAEHDDEGLNCLPAGVPMVDLLPSPFKFIQTPRVVAMLMEAHTAFRQIFIDGRKHPEDPQPSWMGYSVGRWEGDTLVVETTGFNDRSHLDAMGHGHTTALRVTERFHRRDVGHLDMQITIDDPGILTKPVTINVPARLLPDGDLIEYVCAENEKDLTHVSVRR